ncbi:hypothetical protein DFH09DRAFT_1081001 [Mycena vulgaris]|nr:hypothetical protein DFH09DRAFT_1081001 [Mycena vulgaris]
MRGTREAQAEREYCVEPRNCSVHGRSRHTAGLQMQPGVNASISSIPAYEEGGEGGGGMNGRMTVYRDPRVTSAPGRLVGGFVDEMTTHLIPGNPCKGKGDLASRAKAKRSSCTVEPNMVIAVAVEHMERRRGDSSVAGKGDALWREVWRERDALALRREGGRTVLGEGGRTSTGELQEGSNQVKWEDASRGRRSGGWAEETLRRDAVRIIPARLWVGKHKGEKPVNKEVEYVCPTCTWWSYVGKRMASTKTK